MTFLRDESSAESSAFARNILARAVLIFSGLVLLISLGLSWFRVGGGAQGKPYELNGIRTLLRGFNLDFLSDHETSANPAITIGAFGVLIVIATVILLLLLAFYPQRRGLRGAALLSGIAAVLLPLVMFLTTVYGPRIAGLEPAVWLIFVGAVAGLWAAITISDPAAEGIQDDDEDDEEVF
ncbi:hypothetical protein [Acaricomes phytoseiuli]|uniref:hypothetical protein n=1 Tax=Acaricomes phytoseiuli TaxID=291968 RepID=UPI00037B911D|nr:hypothetical protein [Acaricomes phytoseiuli]